MATSFFGGEFFGGEFFFTPVDDITDTHDEVKRKREARERLRLQIKFAIEGPQPPLYRPVSVESAARLAELAKWPTPTEEDLQEIRLAVKSALDKRDEEEILMLLWIQDAGS